MDKYEQRARERQRKRETETENAKFEFQVCHIGHNKYLKVCLKVSTYNYFSVSLFAEEFYLTVKADSPLCPDDSFHRTHDQFKPSAKTC